MPEMYEILVLSNQLDADIYALNPPQAPVPVRINFTQFHKTI